MIISSTAFLDTQRDIELSLSEAASTSFGMPSERMARVAARRAFVEMKLRFMQATKDISGPHGESLSSRVRRSTQVDELCQLRDELLDAMDLAAEQNNLHHQAMRRELSQAFQT